jgi:hypothetical protein
MADFTASQHQKSSPATLILMTATAALSHCIEAITIGLALQCNSGPLVTSGGALTAPEIELGVAAALILSKLIGVQLVGMTYPGGLRPPGWLLQLGRFGRRLPFYGASVMVALLEPET